MVLSFFRIANMYQLKLPSYESAIALNAASLQDEQEMDHYHSLDNQVPNTGDVQQQQEQLVMKSFGTDFGSITFPNSGVATNRLPDTPRPTSRVQACTICGRRFASRAELKIHHSRVHRALPPQPLQSQLTINSPPKFTELQTQRQMVSARREEADLEPESVYSCSLCGVVLKTRASFRSHMNSQHDHNRVYRCPHCSKNYFSRQSVHSHKQRCHPFSSSPSSSMSSNK